MERSARSYLFLTCAVLCVLTLTRTQTSNWETACENVRCPNGQVCWRQPGTSSHFCIRGAVVNQTSSLGQAQLDIEDESRSCPHPSTLPRSCVQQCQQHIDCPRSNMACCYNGCGRVCTSAAQQRVVKPGSCPDEPLSPTSPPCRSTCQSDGDCPSVNKCCRTQCGSHCFMPCFHWLNSRQRPFRQWTVPRACAGASRVRD